jgi:putative endonuclease
MNKRQKGKVSEEIAMEFLLKKGLQPISSNYTIKGGELDLIMRDKDFIVFIEVKSLESYSPFYIYESLTKKKKKFISHTIKKWLFENNMQNKPWRFDFVGIILESEQVKSIEHFEFVEL